MKLLIRIIFVNNHMYTILPKTFDLITFNSKYNSETDSE
jgi:hypothetical protein